MAIEREIAISQTTREVTSLMGPPLGGAGHVVDPVFLSPERRR